MSPDDLARALAQPGRASIPYLDRHSPIGRWIDAPGIDGAFVVNGGDILHRWTNERFLSTPHRVRNVSGQVRYAIPFFCDPDHDTASIACRPAARPIIPQNTRRSASAITPSGLPARAISTWRTRRPYPMPSSHPAPAPRQAGEFDALTWKKRSCGIDTAVL